MKYGSEQLYDLSDIYLIGLFALPNYIVIYEYNGISNLSVLLWLIIL